MFYLPIRRPGVWFAGRLVVALLAGGVLLGCNMQALTNPIYKEAPETYFPVRTRPIQWGLTEK